jgi:hypothetical protein
VEIAKEIPRWLMKFLLSSDGSFSKLLTEEGSEIPVDEDSDFVMELPDYVDEKKMKM